MAKTDLALSGLRVLVTRPAAQAEHWQSLLEAQGAQYARVPLMAIVPLTSADARRAIEQRVDALSDYQHLIFVSQNAVQHALPWIHARWPTMPEGTHCYAVGSATANLLRDANVAVCEAGQTMNSEALLALPGLQHVSGEKVLIFRGQGGRPTLADVLSQRGAQVDYCELYAREFPAAAASEILDLEWGQAGDLVAVHSGEALDNWYQLIQTHHEQAWLDLPTLVPGERVAKKAAALGFTYVIEAYNASDKTMLSALIEWRSQST